MHTYSTDNDIRPRVYGLIAIIALVITVFIEAFLDVLSDIIPLSIGVIGIWGIVFGIIWTIHDNWFWKTRVAYFSRITRVPDLSGEWEGWIVTSYQGQIDDQYLHEKNRQNTEGQKIKASLSIDQTWRKVNVRFSTGQSTSDSNAASFITEDGKWPSLSYQYENEGDPLIEGLDMHFGTASLEYRDEEGTESLEGLYYTGPGRENNGKMFFEKMN